MRNTRIGIFGLVVALAACADGPTATRAAARAPNLSVNPGTGTAQFLITGFSYGPEYEDYNGGNCYGTYDYIESTIGGIKVIEYKRVGCAIAADTTGPYIGGTVTYQVSGGGVDGSVLIDGSEYEYLENVPTNQTLYLTAYPYGDFEFDWWVIKDPSGNTHTDTNPSIAVPTNTSDYEFHAQFHKVS